MPALEQIMQMKQRGIPESQIIQSLREQGISPKEINEALSQSTIKSAIGNTSQTTIETEFQKRPIKQKIPEEEYLEQGMQPSIMTSEPRQIEQSNGEWERQYSQQYPQESYQEYPEQQSYDYYQPSDIETINEIAEQIVEERTSELKKQISSINKIKQEIIPEIEKLNKRMEKIENIINELQMAILRKVGEYGENIKDISNELKATQTSFSKMINPVLDKQRGTEENSQSQEEKPRNRKKTPTNFEHYLR